MQKDPMKKHNIPFDLEPPWEKKLFLYNNYLFFYPLAYFAHIPLFKLLINQFNV